MAGTLLDIRKAFVRESGLYQLVVDYNGADYSDNGADYYIRAGQRMLDSMQQHSKEVATFQQDIVSGDHSLTFQYNRSIEKVYVDNGTTRKLMVPRSWNWFKYQINKPVDDWTSDTPLYYCRAIIGLAPQQSGLTGAGGGSPYTDEFTYGSEDLVLADDHWDKTGIIFYPKADATYTMIIKGIWWSRPLSSDTDKNQWSVNHEFLLVQAARWAYEAKRRNRSGMRDMIVSMEPELKGIDNAIIEDEIADLGELEDPGSYDIEYGGI